jgi:AcrR family transcriptional regulator
MAEAHHRKKDPDAVRAKLLNATAELLAAGQPLSIGAVAVHVGVSKGAVQHHFGTREQLLAAMADTFLGAFEAELAEQVAAGAGVAAQAYVRAALGSTDQDSLAHWRALLVAAVVERSVATRWADWVAADRQKDPAPGVNETIMRLAADGLWLSDLLGIYKISAAERSELQTALLNLSTQESRL